MSPPLDAAEAAGLVHRAFDDGQRRVREIVRRVKDRFERRDWTGIRRDTVARLDLHPAQVDRALRTLAAQAGERLADRALWAEMKEAYAAAIVGRDDFELPGMVPGESLARRHGRRPRLPGEEGGSMP